MSRLKKKIKYSEINFPKSLSLDFAKSLILKRAGTSQGAIRRMMDEEDEEEEAEEDKLNNDNNENNDNNYDNRSRNSDDISESTHLQSKQELNSWDMNSLNNIESPKEHVVDFFRVCSLCELRLPRESVEMQVIRKHVVKLRFKLLSLLLYY